MDFKTVEKLSVVGLIFLMHGIDSTKDIHRQNTSNILAVKNKHGDNYDCVDILKQASLQDPAFIDNLHEHKEIMEKIGKRKSKKEVDGKRVKWASKGCPKGKVPIPHKTGKNGHTYNRHFPKASLNQSLDDYNGGLDMVGLVVSQPDLRGASATMSIYHPDGVTAGQSSSAKIVASNIEESVEAGWMVNPDLYHDDKTRFYTRWSSPRGGCYNTDCPGFVVVNADFPLNYAFPQISIPRTTEQHDVDILIQRGFSGGNWYLGVNGEMVGFWRADLFQNLNNSAAVVGFVGEVFSQPPTQNSPPMGSGIFRGDNRRATAYMQNVEVRTVNQFAAPVNYEKVERSRCYLAGWDYSGGELNGFHFLFGGRGGRAGATCLD